MVVVTVGACADFDGEGLGTDSDRFDDKSSTFPSFPMSSTCSVVASASAYIDSGSLVASILIVLTLFSVSGFISGLVIAVISGVCPFSASLFSVPGASSADRDLANGKGFDTDVDMELDFIADTGNPATTAAAAAAAAAEERLSSAKIAVGPVNGFASPSQSQSSGSRCASVPRRCQLS